jgi:hypothetical protein
MKSISVYAIAYIILELLLAGEVDYQKVEFESEQDELRMRRIVFIKASFNIRLQSFEKRAAQDVFYIGT